MTSAAGASARDLSLKAQEDAIALLEQTPAGVRALRVFERTSLLSAGEQLAVTSSWFMHAGGPKTSSFRSAATQLREALNPEIRDALRVLVDSQIGAHSQSARIQAESTWDLAYWVAVESVLADPQDGPPGSMRRIFERPLDPDTEVRTPTAVRTVRWLSEHVYDINDEKLDGDGDAELPMLGDAELARVRRWLKAQEDNGWTLWPGARRTFPQYPGPMPAIEVTHLAKSWKVTVKGVGTVRANAPEAVLRATATLLADFEAAWTRGDQAGSPEENLAYWIHRLAARDAVLDWLRELTADSFEVAPEGQ